MRAAASLVSGASDSLDTLGAELAERFRAQRCVLTDSGTSALVLALRLVAGDERTVALPGYGCVDITSAVRFAGVKATLYDVDPTTLSPDLDSVERALKRGARAIVVAHYYGYPADVPSVRELARGWDVPIIEDAAQAAGGELWRSPLGSLGDVSILSFGRGKGLFGGGGGALLGRSEIWPDRAPTTGSLGSRRGVGEVAAAATQWVLGRPHLYALPASMPWLHLGEMVYRPAHEPGAFSRASATFVRDALASEKSEHRSRARKARALYAVSNEAEGLTPIRTIPGGESGYLRFAAIDRSGTRAPASRLGVMRGYPLTLLQQPELASQLIPGQPPLTGADELCRSLFTLPTHFQIGHSELQDLEKWLRASAGPRLAPGARPQIGVRLAEPQSSNR